MLRVWTTGFRQMRNSGGAATQSYWPMAKTVLRHRPIASLTVMSAGSLWHIWNYTPVTRQAKKLT